MRQTLARDSDVRPSVITDIVEAAAKDVLAEWPAEASPPAPVNPTPTEDWLAEFAVESSAGSDLTPAAERQVNGPAARQQAPPVPANRRRPLQPALLLQHRLRRWSTGAALAALLLVSGVIGWSVLERSAASPSHPRTVLLPTLSVEVPAQATVSSGSARERVKVLEALKAREVPPLPQPIPPRNRDERVPRPESLRGADSRRVPQPTAPRGAGGRRLAQAVSSEDGASIAAATPVAPIPATPPLLAVTSRPTASLDNLPRPNTSPLPAPPPGTAVAPATPSLAAPTTVSKLPTPRATETTPVLAVLDQYRRAFSALDARTVEAFWLGVDRRALERAFDRLEQQAFDFDRCLIEFSDAQAVASCDGTARYVPKVGSKTPRVESRRWTFTLTKTNDAWVILRVDSRQGRF